MALHIILEDLTKVVFTKKERTSKTYSAIYEDNRGVLELSKELKCEPNLNFNQKKT